MYVSIMKRVYLAGPDVFFPKAKERAQELKGYLAKFNLEGVFPLDADIEFEPNELGPEQGEEDFFEANVALLKASDAVLANIGRFRSPSADVGTAWEMGFAFALGKPVVGYGADCMEYKSAVEEGGAAFQVDNSEVEDFGLEDNLMLECGSVGWFESAHYAAAYLAFILGESKHP